MPAPEITALPPAPLRSESPTTFSGTAETFVEALPGLVTEINAFGSYLDGLGLDGNSWKGVVRVATTAAGTLATGFENGDTIDGVVLATGDRILIKNQAAGAENGIYVVAASGAPARATDCDTGAEMLGMAVIVAEGTANADTMWFCTTNATITIGSTALVFSQLTGGSFTAAADTDIWTGTDNTKGVTSKALFDAAKEQTLTDGATITPDFGVGLNFKVTLAGNRTLANPTNAKEGQSGVITITQDATGSRTLAYGSNWRFPGGSTLSGVLSTAANSIDVLSYIVRSNGTILATLAKSFSA